MLASPLAFWPILGISFMDSQPAPPSIVFNMRAVKTETGLSISVAGVYLEMILDSGRRRAVMEQSGQVEESTTVTEDAVEVARKFLLARARRFLGPLWTIEEGQFSRKPGTSSAPDSGVPGEAGNATLADVPFKQVGKPSPTSYGDSL